MSSNFAALPPTESLRFMQSSHKTAGEKQVQSWQTYGNSLAKSHNIAIEGRALLNKEEESHTFSESHDLDNAAVC